MGFIIFLAAIIAFYVYAVLVLDSLHVFGL